MLGQLLFTFLLFLFVIMIVHMIDNYYKQ